MGRLHFGILIAYMYTCSPSDGRSATFVGVDHLIDVAKTGDLVDVAKYTSSTMKLDQARVKTSVSGFVHIYITAYYSFFTIVC